MSDFFTTTKCELCGNPLSGARIVSRLSKDLKCICLECAEKERQHPDFNK